MVSLFCMLILIENLHRQFDMYAYTSLIDCLIQTLLKTCIVLGLHQWIL